jgi:hypothetical protein
MKGRVALIVSLVAGVGAASLQFAWSQAAWSQDAFVQETAPALPINPKDIGNYCIYASRVYSNGAQICVSRGNMTLGCEKGEWKIDLTKFGIDCRNEPAGFRPGETR